MIRTAGRGTVAVLLLLVPFAPTPPVHAQTSVSANLIQGLAKGIGGAVVSQLTGYALSAIGPK